jgi:ABC-2 type transport system ATP-binding protein
MQQTTAAIAATGLRKSFGDTVVLDGIDLNVPAGTIFSLLGPNGAGKTTTVKILSTLIAADAGEVRVAGHDLRREPDLVRAAIGVTGQFSAIDGLLTGRENLILMADLNHLGRREGRRRADELLARLDLAGAGAKVAATYSGGMQRRLDLAMTLVGHPRIIFLDEPTAGLDPQSRLALWDLLGELHAAGQTIMLTTHYMEEADRLCNRVAIMDHGRILALDTPAALKQSIGADTVVTVKATGDLASLAAQLSDQVAGVTRTRQADDGVQLHMQGSDRLIPRIVLAAERAGFDLVDVSVAEPSLETVFINLTGKELRD